MAMTAGTQEQKAGFRTILGDTPRYPEPGPFTVCSFDKLDAAAKHYYCFGMDAGSRSHFEQWLQREFRASEVHQVRLAILRFLARDTENAAYVLRNWTYWQIRDAALEMA
jgi:hypothetical protein